MTEVPELTCVCTCHGWDLAQIYKSKLEAAEIPVLLKHEASGLIFGITVDGLGEVRLMVPVAYAAEAKALLEEISEPFLDEPEEVEQPLQDEVDEIVD